MHKVLLPGALGASIALSAASLAAQPIPIDADRELMITDVGVVDDARAIGSGAWSFGTLMTRQAGVVPPPRFVEAWMRTWLTPQVVNGHNVFDQGKADAIEEFLDKWLLVSGGTTLDLDLAPFRLTAIVNRPDLARGSAATGITSAGELRFVFNAFEPDDPSDTHPFNVIFEFDVPASSCVDLVGWHQQWHALAGHPVGSPAFNAALQAITDVITMPDPTNGRPNGSHLSQLRSNEFAVRITSLNWDLREWNVVEPAGQPMRGLLTNVTTKQTPRFAFVANGAQRQRLAEWLTINTTDVLAGNHVVPLQFTDSQGTTVNFLGGEAINDNFHVQPNGSIGGGAGTLWWAPGFGDAGSTAQNLDVRHGFALQTCSGCHFQETDTPFVMVGQRQVGAAAGLAGFLTGINVPDPIDSSIVRPFNDLRFRAAVLQRILAIDCTAAASGGGAASAVAEVAAIQSLVGTRIH